MAKYWAKPHLKSKTLGEKRLKKEEAMLFEYPTGPAMTGKRYFYSKLDDKMAGVWQTRLQSRYF